MIKRELQVPILKCIFVSDLHGNTKKIEKLIQTMKKEKPDMMFIGGDLLPNSYGKNIEKYVEKNILLELKKLKDITKIFLILGNDDPRIFEELFIQADKDKIIKYAHNKTIKVNDFFVTGYSYVPPTPFQLKDWEKYDVSRYVDVGAVSPEQGFRTIKINEDEKRYSTISEDLKNLSKNSPPDKTIYLFHSPPYDSYLDLADLHGKKIDYVPVDVHVGSIAIQRFIKNKKPFLTLHGHVHESARLSGKWMQKFGNTYSFSAAHDGPELAIVRFDTDDLSLANRELVKI